MSPHTPARAIVFASIFINLGACGTYVPSLRTWPDDNVVAEDNMVTSIINTVRCELSATVTSVVTRDLIEAQDRRYPIAFTSFLNNWGVQVAINLTIVERSSVNPTAILTPFGAPEYKFTLAGGLSASSEATRLQKTNVFYFVSELYRPEYFIEKQPDGRFKDFGREKCLTATGERYGSPLINSDLRLFSLLNSRLAATALNIAPSPGNTALTEGEQNVLSQTVSFKIVMSGTVTPAWTLTRASVNPSNLFFNAGRDNTQELVITFGPLDKSIKGRRALNELAQATHITTQIQTGIQNLANPFR